ncbi:hypothetical protein [Shewanella maritima]|uniref:hypothetical protein n=1 Tax=Shewanella maritima TaxID=2520507 RepID=UPI001A922373|nr:hypothetical protein [Shewanella maritima]
MKFSNQARLLSVCFATLLCSQTALASDTQASNSTPEQSKVAQAKSGATWVGILGFETARTVKPESKQDIQQVEAIVNGIGINFAGLKWDNTLAAKVNRRGEISVARNWAYGYWNDNFGVSIDLIKSDWKGTGPIIGAVGLAYKNRWDNLSLRINPTVARLSNKLTNGSTFDDTGMQLNVRMDYQINDRLSLRLHPQYASWRSDQMGETLKVELGASVNLTEDKRHKLMLVNEHFLVKNSGTGMRVRYVGEDSPIGGYVPGTEQTFKLRYAYVF